MFPELACWGSSFDNLHFYRCALLSHELVSLKLPAKPLPTVIAPDDVQSVLVQLNPLDQQAHDPVLLDGEKMLLHLAHLAHRHQYRRFVHFLPLTQRHAGLPNANDHLGLLQCLVDLRQHGGLNF